MKRWAKGAKAATPEKKTPLKRLGFSESTKSSILGHIFRRKREKSANISGTGPILTILPKWQAPCDKPVPQASSAPPFPSALQSACNGLVVPPPPTASPGRRKLGRSAALCAPDSPAAPWALAWPRVSLRGRSPPPHEKAGCAATALLTWRPPIRRLTYAARREAERASGSEQERRAAGSPRSLSPSLPPPGGRREPPATPPRFLPASRLP